MPFKKRRLIIIENESQSSLRIGNDEKSITKGQKDKERKKFERKN